MLGCGSGGCSCGGACGCMSHPAPVGLGEANILDWLGNVGRSIVGFQRPVFTATGEKIGYWTGDLNGVCQGKITVERPDLIGKSDPATWVTKDFYWRDVLLTNLCVTNNLHPPWVSDADYSKSAPAATTTPSEPITHALQIVQRQSPLLLIGGGMLVAFLLLRRD